MTAAPARMTPHATLTPYQQMEPDRVVSIANSRLAVLPSVKAFEIAPMKRDAFGLGYLTQIRAVPSIDGVGVEFRYNLPLHQSGSTGFSDLAWDVVGRAHQFFVDASLEELGAMARDAVAPILAVAEAVSVRPRLSTIGVCFDFDVPTPHLSADIEMLGDDLALGIERAFGFSVEHLGREVARFVDDHVKRDAARVRAAASHASGWIDQTALHAIDAAGLDRRDAIDMAMREGWVDISYRDEQERYADAALQQVHGVIIGSVMPRDRSWGLKHGDLIVWGKGIPHALRGSLTGRRVGDVFDNRVLPADATIGIIDEVASVDPDSDDDEIDGWLRLMLDIPVAEIDETSGEPRAEWLSPADWEDK